MEARNRIRAGAPPGTPAMAEASVGLLVSISEFCRRAGMAESTFGRRAVNDGKFVSRLRDGARITPETLERVSVFLTSQGAVAQLPLLRQPPEVPAVRQYVQREGGGGTPRQPRARTPAPRAARGPRVR